MQSKVDHVQMGPVHAWLSHTQKSNLESILDTCMTHRAVRRVKLCGQVVFVDALVVRGEVVAGEAQRAGPNFRIKVDASIRIEDRRALLARYRFVWQDLRKLKRRVRSGRSS